MTSNDNALNWFEISVMDMPRAKKFYCQIFGFEDMETMDMEGGEEAGMQMAGFPYDPAARKVGGALVKSIYHTPSMDGAVVYLNGNPDLAIILDRVEAAGGKVLMPKMKISDEIGYMAYFADSEGNRMALHSQN